MKKSLLFLFCSAFIYLRAASFAVTDASDGGAGSFREESANAGASATNLLSFSDSFTIPINDGTIPLNASFEINLGIQVTTFPAGGSDPGWTLANGSKPSINTSSTTGKIIIATNIGESAIDGGFIIAGSSNVTFSGTNTFTGGVSITGGVLTLGNNAGLGTGILTLSNGILSLNEGIKAVNPITLDAGTSRAIDVAAGNTATLSGVIGGTLGSALSKTGDGALTLSGINTYTTGTVISGGKLILKGSLSSTGDVTVSGTSTFDISGATSSLTIGALSVDSGSKVSLGSRALTFGTTADISAAGIISGTGGSLIKQGTGSVTFSGANTFDSGLHIADGSVVLDNNTGLGTGTLLMDEGTSLTLNNGMTAKNKISLTAAGSRIFSVPSGDTANLLGVINGLGSLEKKDSGILVLEGVNTYSGGTTITKGTLSLSGTGQILSTGDLTIKSFSIFDISGITKAVTIADLEASAGTTINLGAKSLTFGTGSSTTVAAIITGDIGGSLTKKGTGTVTFQEVNTFSGKTTVSGGTLIVNGVLPGPVTIASTATLKGTGSIGGKLTIGSGGSLRPGNSIGTISLASLTLDAGSITTIEFNPTDTSQIDVTDTAILAGTLNPIHPAGDYDLTGSYEIITAGSISGTFDTITSGLPEFIFGLNYTGTSVFLFYSNPISTTGLTGNILKFANYLNNNSPVTDEYIALAALTGNTQYNALNSTSPARNSFGTYVSQMALFSLSHKVSNYLNDKRFSNSHEVSRGIADLCMSNNDGLVAGNSYWDYTEQGTAEPAYGFWMNGFVNLASQDSENQNLPFDFITGAVLSGLDWESTYKEHILGIAIGYANSSVTDHGGMGSSDISSFAASLYADFIYDSFYAQGIFWGVFNQISNHRTISYPGVNTKASADFCGWQINPHIELGYSHGSQAFEAVAYIAVDYVQNDEDHYSETGAENLNMTMKAQKSSMVQTEAGIRFYQGINRSNCRFGIKEDISFINRVPFDTGTITTAIFGAENFVTLTSFTQTQTLGAINVALFIEVGKEKDTVISLGYEGQFGSQYVSNGASLTLSTEF
jgi:autotransporter-associated beta strand protein